MAPGWRVTLGDWARSLRGPKVEALFRGESPAPFFADVLKGVGGTERPRAQRHRVPPPARRTGGVCACNTGPAAGRRFRHPWPRRHTARQPSPGDAAAVRRQLGPLQGRLPVRPTSRCARGPPAGHLLAARGGGTKRFHRGRLLHPSEPQAAGQGPHRLSTDRGPLRIVCETGISAVPLLLAILNMTLTKDCVPLHASAFLHRRHRGRRDGLGERGEDRSSAGLRAAGARYVGDEWVLLAADGHAAFGIPNRSAFSNGTWRSSLKCARTFAPRTASFSGRFVSLRAFSGYSPSKWRGALRSCGASGEPSRRCGGS